jgi:hypothetical protein
MMHLKYLFIIFIPTIFFGQNKPIKLHVLSVTSTDSIVEERKFTIQYALENTTNQVVSFFLQPANYFRHILTLWEQIFFTNCFKEMKR